MDSLAYPSSRNAKLNLPTIRFSANLDLQEYYIKALRFPKPAELGPGAHSNYIQKKRMLKD